MAARSPDEHVLRRLLMGKELLMGVGSLGPTSDPISVARAILAAHDAAELALAAVADHVGVQRSGGPSYLMDYAASIQKATKALQGYPYLRQLNEVRRAFKHEGIVPDPRQWYQVTEKIETYANSWCQEHLGMSLSDLDLDTLIADGTVRKLYGDARALFDRGQYKETLEVLSRAVFLALRRFPGILYPTIGKRNVEDALRFSAFGVRPGDFLALQELLPEINLAGNLDDPEVRWDTRRYGHMGNWSEANVAFCLQMVLDVVLKVQHAPWCPWPVHFYLIFEDVITAKHDGVNVWRTPEDWVFTKTPVQVVRTLSKGEALRGTVSPQRGPRTNPLGEPDIETSDVLGLFCDSIPGRFCLVRAIDVELSSVPKGAEAVRAFAPHFLAEGDTEKG